MTSLFKPKIPQTAIPSPEVPAMPEVEDARDISRFKKRRKGRQQTIKAGDLEPLDIGKKTLLG